MKVTKNFVIAVVLILLALGGGFFAGMQYQKSKSVMFMAGGNGQYGQFRARFGSAQGGQVFRPVRGQVLSVNDTSLTVKMNGGTSKIIVLSPSTSFMKSAQASKSDIATGDTVMVLGSQNSDGSVTATAVQINPQYPGISPSPTAGQ